MTDYRERGARSDALQRLREEASAWCAASHAVSASGDAGFSDDGESPQPRVGDKVLKPAAVLVLVVAQSPVAERSVLFTQRTAHLTDHAGQISFPGGRVEDTDRDAAHTAVRETHEETGLAPSEVDVVGALPAYTTGTGYLITPIVGVAQGPLVLAPDATEVAECFEVPLDFLIDVRNHRHESAMYKGRLRDYYAIPYQHRYIWGATAGMLITLSRVVAHARGGSYSPPVRRAPDSGR